jgi:hypothetical protein
MRGVSKHSLCRILQQPRRAAVWLQGPCCTVGPHVVIRPASYNRCAAFMVMRAPKPNLRDALLQGGRHERRDGLRLWFRFDALVTVIAGLNSLFRQFRLRCIFQIKFVELLPARTVSRLNRLVAWR